MIKNVVRSTQIHKTSTEFATLDVFISVYTMQYTPKNKTTQLKFENSVQTAFRLSPVSFHAIANETVQK